jgi:hypothetical protein
MEEVDAEGMMVSKRGSSVNSKLESPDVGKVMDT